MTPVARLSSMILGLASFGVARGLAAANREVVPGPGLPSLAELGITSADLYNMGRPVESSMSDTSFTSQYGAKCGPDGDAYVDVDDIIACYHYLRRLNQNCVVPDNHKPSYFCVAGAGKVTGQSVTPHSTSSPCRNVAKTVLWTIDHCTRPDRTVAGVCKAWGNGDLLVGSFNKDYTLH
ncbi:hypothetical protein NOR_08302 [Metarhizium rileyi]|uniref:Secreted protein n=1 Tax=Metarhizium rileyi (strain RCEF 4871) TaxID=1649241 RepID=A0A166WJ59_METRR|nr:hypothetical protein NOR_08302 [Metarhizium rileyi RCEF 4871]